MNDSEMKRLMAATAAIQLAEAVDAMRRIGEEVEQATGHRVISPERPQITDARRGDLERMLGRVRAGERALTLALGWVGPKDTLGRVLKVIPADAADELTAALVEAGLLAPES